MTLPLLFKLLIIVLLGLIILSLGSGMFFLVKDAGKTNRTRNALTIRIVLSLLLFALLVIGYWADWIRPHGVLPDVPGQHEPTAGRVQNQ